MKGKRTYLAFGAILLAMVAIALLTPQQVNWASTFDRGDKIPYGSYILYERLSDIFPGSEIQTHNQPFYMLEDALEDSGSTSIIITSDLKADDLDVRTMTRFAASGNTIFISAFGLPQLLADTLGIDIRESLHVLSPDSDWTVSLQVPEQQRTFRFRHEDVTYWIADADSTTQIPTAAGPARRAVVIRPRVVLGADSSGHPDFVKIPFGQGAFFIHTVPQAFTNYNMLKRDNNKYVAGCLSQLPRGTVYWDDYYKPFHQAKADTPLRFVLSVPAYKWAFYLALTTAFTYMLFAGKRLQRIIPVLQPPANMSLQFTQTVGTLYYQQRDHRDIAIKKMTYLLERIRQYYMLPTGDIGPAFRSRLAYKSNVSIETINEVFEVFDRDIIRVRYINEEVLIAFNTALEKFYNESGLINK